MFPYAVVVDLSRNRLLILRILRPKTPATATYGFKAEAPSSRKSRNQLSIPSLAIMVACFRMQ